MRTPMTPRRRKAAALAGATAVIAASSLTVTSHTSDIRDTLAGVLVGVMAGVAILFMRKRRDC